MNVRKLAADPYEAREVFRMYVLNNGNQACSTGYLYNSAVLVRELEGLLKCRFQVLVLVLAQVAPFVRTSSNFCKKSSKLIYFMTEHA